MDPLEAKPDGEEEGTTFIELKEAINKLVEEIYKAYKLKEICNALEQILSRFKRKRKEKC